MSPGALITDRDERAQGGSEKFLLTSGEVQVLAGISHTALWKWCRAGKLNPIRIGRQIGYHGGQMRLFRRSEVLKFLAERNRRRAKIRRPVKKSRSVGI